MLEKPENFRDLGGIPGQDGRRVAPRRLLRSGELVGLTRGDIETLADEYTLRCIIDLRGEGERNGRPDDGVPGACYHSIDIMRDMGVHAPSAGRLDELMTHPDSMDNFMRMSYELMVTDPEAQAGFRRMVELLAALDEGACVIHCFAGKDRTGVAAAVLLTILGASREDILADYLKTNELRAEANRMMLERARREGADEAHLAGIATALGVKQQYLEHAYYVAHREYGSFENFVREGLGVDDLTAARMQQLYLV